MDSDTQFIAFIVSFHFKMSRKLDGVNVIYNHLVNTNAIPELSKLRIFLKPLTHCYTQEKHCVTSPYNSASKGQCILV